MDDRRPSRAPRYAHRHPAIGWREWVALPQLGLTKIKAKIDTGARTSCLHAFNLVFFPRRGEQWVRFVLHPLQRSSRETITAEARVQGVKRVRSSSGHVTIRPVIVTEVRLAGQIWPVELTLANRDAMGFRMLLSRRAVRGRFLIDAGRSYVAGRPPVVKKHRRRRKSC